MWFRATIAILHGVTTNVLRLLDCQPFQEGRVCLCKTVCEGDHNKGSVPKHFILMLAQSDTTSACLADVKLIRGSLRIISEEEIQRYLDCFGQKEKLIQPISRDFDNTNDPGSDLRHTKATRVSVWKENLDSFRTGCSLRH